MPSTGQPGGLFTYLRKQAVAASTVGGVAVSGGNSPPPGFTFLLGQDGQQLLGADGQELYGVA